MTISMHEVAEANTGGLSTGDSIKNCLQTIGRDAPAVGSYCNLASNLQAVRGIGGRDVNVALSDDTLGTPQKFRN